MILLVVFGIPVVMPVLLQPQLKPEVFVHSWGLSVETDGNRDLVTAKFCNLTVKWNTPGSQSAQILLKRQNSH